MKWDILKIIMDMHTEFYSKNLSTSGELKWEWVLPNPRCQGDRIREGQCHSHVANAGDRMQEEECYNHLANLGDNSEST